MICPFCNKQLVNKHINYYCCSTPAHLCQKPSNSHYQILLDMTDNEIVQIIMIVLPYKIITYPNEYSIIRKLDNTGNFYTMLNTSDLNVGPIYPKSEAELLGRIETILVFS